MCSLLVTSIFPPIKSLYTSVSRKSVKQITQALHFSSAQIVSRIFLTAQIELELKILACCAASVAAALANCFWVCVCVCVFLPSCWQRCLNVSLSTSTVVTPAAPQQTDAFLPFKDSVLWKLQRENLRWQTCSPGRVSEVTSISPSTWDVLFLLLTGGCL